MSFLGEEVGYNSDSDEYSEGVERFEVHDGIPDSVADFLFSEAGGDFTPPDSETMVTVLPQPLLLLSSEENLISETKMTLGIDFCLEKFQIQAILGSRSINNIHP